MLDAFLVKNGEKTSSIFPKQKDKRYITNVDVTSKSFFRRR